MSDTYNSYFFTNLGFASDDYTNRERWMPFFAKIAENIIKVFNPKMVLDAGCATGYVVEALRDRGVEAWGFDISEFAISHVREDIRPYCFVHSITDRLPNNVPQSYDLVINIEVLEHLSPEMGSEAIANLCSYSDTVVFTSSPNDITDMTHINVRLSEYWCREFAKNMFFREYIHPVDFICPWAMLFKKYDNIENAIFSQEMSHRILNSKQEAEYKKEIDNLNEEIKVLSANLQGAGGLNGSGITGRAAADDDQIKCVGHGNSEWECGENGSDVSQSETLWNKICIHYPRFTPTMQDTQIQITQENQNKIRKIRKLRNLQLTFVFNGYENSDTLH